jgi:hypothetical protein
MTPDTLAWWSHGLRVAIADGSRHPSGWVQCARYIRSAEGRGVIA